jgi:adenylate cyclase
LSDPAAQRNGEQRRLATIVAVDVAGYSARAEADERAAAAAVAALRERIDAACEAHGGRIFNTAGDGFMLEFPTVSGALEAAAAIAGDPDPPVRVGVHLGEVMVTPTGDLLGHGVNVAARIQALAPAGGVLVSADVQRAIRGPLAARLSDKGPARLDKMDETIRIFALGAEGEGARHGPRLRLPDVRGRARPALMAAAAVLVLAVLGVWLLRERIWPAPRDDTSVAVVPFKVLGADAAARTVADGLVEEINGVLGSGEGLTLSAATPEQASVAAGPATPKAGLVLSGSVERAGDALQVRVRLDDARLKAVLWTETFTGSVADPRPLEVAVAAKATAVIGFALNVRGPGSEDVDGETMADIVQAQTLQTFVFPDGALKARALLQRVVARAPRSAAAHAALGGAAGVAFRQAPQGEDEALRLEAQAESRKAIALDPRNGWPYVTLSRTTSPRQAWAEREGLLDRAIALSPGQFYGHDARGYLLAEVGRTREGLASIQQGQALNSLHPGGDYRAAIHLAELGHYPEARRLSERLASYWPQAWTDLARAALVSLYGPTEEARAVLAASLAHPYLGEAPSLRVIAAFVEARAGHDPKARSKAARAIVEAVRTEGFRRSDAIPMLCLLGDLDDAFALADAGASDRDEFNLFPLFAPTTAAMREDPRFWRLTVRKGLADYWMKTGRWPDICRGMTGEKACPVRVAEAIRAEKG